jgi:ABC-type uncharacterized transport system involved in gliding motility auxiliary subunit
MKTSQLKFLGIFGFVLLVVGTALLTTMGSSVLAVTYGHIIIGVLAILVWFVGEGTRSLGEKGGVIPGHNLRFGTGAVAYTVLFIALLVIINWFSGRYNRRFDLTKNGAFSLAPQSIEVLKNLSKPVKLVAFQAESEKLGPVGELLGLYGGANSSKVTYEIVDPRTKPHLIEKYQMSQGNQLYIQYGDGDDKGVSRISEISEQAITSAILKLKGDVSRKVYFVSGHGEPSLEDTSPTGLKTLVDSLKNDNLKVDQLITATLKSIPEDAASVLLVAPSKQLQDAEITMLREYVAKGGGLGLFIDPRGSSQVRELASHFGIKIRDDVVIDTVQRLFAGPALGLEPIAKSYGAHTITRDLRGGQDLTLFNIASSLEVPATQPSDDVKYVELVKTGSDSWSESNLAAIFDVEEPTVEFSDGDLRGPVTLGAVYEKSVATQSEEEKGDGEKANSVLKSKVFVFGDSDWIKNGVIGNVFNKDLVLNSVSWVSGQEVGLSIRPRALSASETAMTPEDVKTILVSSFVLPELILLFGLYVWWRRREAGAVLS